MTDTAARVSAGRLGVWVASATAVVGVVSLVLSMTTPPRSGAYCSDGCIAYPYTDVAAYVPRDYLWMYPEVLLTLLFMVLAVCLAQWVPLERRLPAAVGVCFAVIGGTVLLVDYGIQLTVLQPALLAGQTEGMSALTQYNPHGVFIALENVGYAVLGIAFLFLGAALTAGTSRLERAVRWVFIVGGVLDSGRVGAVRDDLPGRSGRPVRGDVDVHYLAGAHRLEHDADRRLRTSTQGRDPATGRGHHRRAGRAMSCPVSS